MAVVVRRILEHEGPRMKTVRLAALLDAPSAFASTYEREAAFADELWDDRARAGASGEGRATFFALDDEHGDVVGLVGGHREDASPGEVELVAMWTAPAVRRTGAGTALVRAVVEWAGADPVSLWVTRGNEPAQRLYGSCGFEVTGDHQPLPSDPCQDEVRMRRAAQAPATTS
jgi:RimJ/RimL family protein N-acetyltransferase